MCSLKQVEQDLAAISKTAGCNVDRLVDIVKENGAIQQKVKANLEASVMQNVLQAVLASDTDEDFQLNAREMKRLETRLANLPGIEFDVKNFRALVDTQHDMQLRDIMALFRNLKQDIPEEENVFHLRPEKMK